MRERIKFKLNHADVELDVEGDRPLLWVLRTELGLTGTKYGCGEGYCGACTVLLDGEAVQACQTNVSEVRGREVVTIEGLATNGHLHPVQQAFVDHDALQCGFCTPGMVLTAAAMLKKTPHPTRDDIVKGMNKNLCRCAAYHRIVQAVEAAAKGTP